MIDFQICPSGLWKLRVNKLDHWIIFFVEFSELDGMPKTEAAQTFHVSRNTINLWLKRKAETGDFQAKPNHPPGNNHKITDWDKFREFVNINGDKTQAEMAELWSGDISQRTISRAKRKNWLHPQKKTYGYQERDEKKRAEFSSELLTLRPEQIVYADEAGMDNRDDYGYSYNFRGERFYALKSGRRTGRVNMIAALCDRQLLAPFTLEGACNRTVFELWLESCTGPGVETRTSGGD